MRKNRNIEEMVLQVRRWLNDEAESFTEPNIQISLQEAFESICGLLVESEARICLRRTSPVFAPVVDQKTYDLPEDCLRLEKLEYTENGTDWQTVRHEFSREGRAFLRRSAEYLMSGRPNLMSWCESDEWNKILINPIHKTVLGTSVFRFVYTREPNGIEQIPEGAVEWAININYVAGDIVAYGDEYYEVSYDLLSTSSPDIDTAGYEHIKIRYDELPKGFDTAIEYFAAAILSHEELEDGKPIGAFGQEFARKFDELKMGVCRKLKPKRRYVRYI